MFESNNVRIDDRRATETPEAPRRRTATKWGDREQRRRDILDAARARIAEGGYLSLNMRDLAAGAGVSPATLYSYFATKEELFATLYAEAIRAHTETYRPVAEADHDLTTLLVHVIEHHLGLYRAYGRHFTLWSAMRSPDATATATATGNEDEDGHAHGPGDDGGTGPAATFPRELIDELRTATREHNRLLMTSIRRAAARDGRRVADERLVPSFLWSVLNGLADHFTSERRSLDPFPAEQLVGFAATRLVLALTEPA